MNFQQAVKFCLAEYATFSGRAARSEFWYWQLFQMIGGLMAEIFDFGIGLDSGPMSTIFWVLTVLPSLAVTARRLHDTGHSAWWMAYGAVLMAIGFWRQSALLRWQALVVLAFSIARVFLNGVSQQSQGYRVLSFLALGALLLAISFAYQKDWLRLRG